MTIQQIHGSHEGVINWELKIQNAYAGLDIGKWKEFHNLIEFLWARNS